MLVGLKYQKQTLSLSLSLSLHHPFSKDNIAKVIKNLDSNKAHGHDTISIRMLKFCRKSILKSLELMFRSCIGSGKYPNDWKKLILSRSIKKVKNRYWQTVVQY